MTSEYKVAVIVPTLNEEKYIATCVQSVYEQTFPFDEMEIIIADGGSTDRTCEIVREMGVKWPNVRLIPNPKRIQSCGFNVGVRESTAPIVIRLDAHATYEKTYIERCVSHLQQDETIGNTGGRCIIEPANGTLMARANAILNRSRFGIGGSDFRVGTVARESDTVPFGAFRREVIDKIGGMREDLPRGEDNEYNSRIRKAGYRIWFDPEIISTYFARPTLASSAKQMYNNGLSIGWLLKIDRASLGLRHLVPLLFVISIPVTLGLSMLLYLIVAILADVSICSKEGKEYFFPFLILFPAIHLSYGWGTIIGLIQKK